MTDNFPAMHADCPRCDGNGIPTGWRRIDPKDGRTYVYMRCDACRLEFDVWRREWEEKGLIPPPQTR